MSRSVSIPIISEVLTNYGICSFAANHQCQLDMII